RQMAAGFPRFYFSVMGLAFSFVNFALPWISGTGPASFLGGLLRSISGRFIPCLAILITSGIVFADFCGNKQKLPKKRVTGL
ncbi:hypothetical protein, partial [Anaerotruncus rubiinfantis]|uniref:hypothetical protein n=1 Tax=Anaerotruncus rubiinfantis TaxID=1720200 RepID=UPI001A9AF0F1